MTSHWYCEFWQADNDILDGKARQHADNSSLNSEISHSGLGSKICKEFMDTVWGYPEDFITGNNKPDVEKLKEDVLAQNVTRLAETKLVSEDL